MKPEKLIVCGWGPYKQLEKIDFSGFDGKGLFLVTGATGAGKTTIFDAITYALYGNLSGTMREKNSVRSDFADADTPTFVELFMQHGGEEYHIRRNPEYFRPKKRGGGTSLTKEKENAVLYLPDGRTVEGTKEVNAKMQEILVLDYSQFKQITMIAQGEFAKLLTASPKEKTGIFRDIFGTGVYERFAQGLRARSGVLYGCVAEQKNKLEEDIRLLLVGAGEEEWIQTLLTLTEGDNWNYESIAEELSVICDEAQKREEQLQTGCAEIQAQNDRLTEEVTKKKLENDQIDSLEQAKETLLLLKEKESETEQKKNRLKRGRSAQSLSDSRLKVQNAKRNMQEKISQQAVLKKTCEEQLAEQKKLQFFEEKRASLEQYLELCRLIAENTVKEKEEEAVFEKTAVAFEKAKKDYLTAERVCAEKQAEFTQADKRYRHAIVGVAARMLKPGEACPVCGSVEHPNPAKEEPGLPSQEELSGLKDAWQQAETEREKAQEKAMSLRALSEEQEKRLKETKEKNGQLKGEAGALEATFAEEESLKEGGFFTKAFREKSAFIREKEDRASQLSGMITAGRERSVQLTGALDLCKKELAESEKALEERLAGEGFLSEEECEKALLDRQEIKRLEEEIKDFSEKRTAAESVKTHLEHTLTHTKKHDLTFLLERMEEEKRAALEKQNELKRAHAFLGEAKKTRQQFLIKQKKMESASKEYGYVKDLDNLASGNNAKRLVFEQYVLAGYFEKILRAANLRFYKMTGGRYEMSRVEEAEDGRIKDSLEIQVTDHYTGRMRSVKTLSGGESFKASLSLALGMSDVIQAANGGIRVDTLFIDEGFGALDSESLDQACETLMSLVEHNRLIGIISHVPELRERIDSQILIKKTNSGSSVKIRV